MRRGEGRGVGARRVAANIIIIGWMGSSEFLRCEVVFQTRRRIRRGASECTSMAEMNHVTSCANPFNKLQYCEDQPTGTKVQRNRSKQRLAAAALDCRRAAATVKQLRFFMNQRTAKTVNLSDYMCATLVRNNYIV